MAHEGTCLDHQMRWTWKLFLVISEVSQLPEYCCGKLLKSRVKQWAKIHQADGWALHSNLFCAGHPANLWAWLIVTKIPKDIRFHPINTHNIGGAGKNIGGAGYANILGSRPDSANGFAQFYVSAIIQHKILVNATKCANYETKNRYSHWPNRRKKGKDKFSSHQSITRVFLETHVSPEEPAQQKLPDRWPNRRQTSNFCLSLPDESDTKKWIYPPKKMSPYLASIDIPPGRSFRYI